MNKFAVFAVALSPAMLAAQEPGGGPLPSNVVSKVIHIRYGNPESIAATSPARSVFIRGNNGLKAVVVQGTPDNVAAVSEVIKDLDVPSASETARDIEVGIYVLGAGAKAQSGGSIGSEMQPVVKQLEAAFPYGSYQLLDTMLLRSREGETASTTGVMKAYPGTQQQHANRYVIDYRLALEPGETHRTIRLDKFEFRTHTGEAGSDSSLNVGFETNLQLHEGQKIVVGKTDVDDGDSALFVVLTAKVLE